METLISSIITGIVAITTCLITQGMSNSKTRALIEYRLMELEKKQDRHNDVIERTYKLEETSAIQDVRITNLEKKVSHE
jgi:uncharacterized coiled-coil protein SlyX